MSDISLKPGFDVNDNKKPIDAVNGLLKQKVSDIDSRLTILEKKVIAIESAQAPKAAQNANNPPAASTDTKT